MTAQVPRAPRPLHGRLAAAPLLNRVVRPLRRTVNCVAAGGRSTSLRTSHVRPLRRRDYSCSAWRGVGAHLQRCCLADVVAHGVSRRGLFARRTLQWGTLQGLPAEIATGDLGCHRIEPGHKLRLANTESRSYFVGKPRRLRGSSDHSRVVLEFRLYGFVAPLVALLLGSLTGRYLETEAVALKKLDESTARSGATHGAAARGGASR